MINDNVNKRKVEIAINKNLAKIFFCCRVKMMINDNNDKLLMMRGKSCAPEF